ncbi:GIY-YIG nuclease family protein [Woodsholea maritima]|uniref:GIY-YIG nuclease family protein n=1 Tax=Woodsholea maritima TaxID=240237 RepID=UPI00037A1A7C|nr:GIY-YIG nuclease family protein [Woodsholea maritima]
MEERVIAVYMLASKPFGTLYIGVTSHLLQRIWQHKNNVYPGFAQRYDCKTLVWYETHCEITHAIAREKSLKSYRRQNKINLIETMNPRWCDLSEDFMR